MPLRRPYETTPTKRSRRSIFREWFGRELKNSRLKNFSKNSTFIYDGSTCSKSHSSRDNVVNFDKIIVSNLHIFFKWYRNV